MAVPKDANGRAEGDPGIQSFTLQYRNAPIGTNVTFPYTLCDINGNQLGVMVLNLYLDQELWPDGTFRRWYPKWSITGIPAEYVIITNVENQPQQPPTQP